LNPRIRCQFFIGSFQGRSIQLRLLFHHRSPTTIRRGYHGSTWYPKCEMKNMRISDRCSNYHYDGSNMDLKFIMFDNSEKLTIQNRIMTVNHSLMVTSKMLMVHNLRFGTHWVSPKSLDFKKFPIGTC
jgi:hypothetical protein